MSDVPDVAVTLLLISIAASTNLGQQASDEMPRVLDHHDMLVEQTITAHRGQLITHVRSADGCHVAVFERAHDAVAAATALQQALYAEVWSAPAPVHVRMALDTGDVHVRAGDDVYGNIIRRAGRLLAVAHGGQVLLSHAIQVLANDAIPRGVSMRALGPHRLRAHGWPEQVYQLEIAGQSADFPPLATPNPTPGQLPVQPTPLIGREKETAAVCGLLEAPDVRLVTLTGAGGTGKTRLALHVAAALLDAFADGIYFVDLALLQDSALVTDAIARTLGLQETGDQPLLETLTGYLLAKHALLLLDNFEHVIAAAPLINTLLLGAPRLRVLVTSRAGLQLRAQHEYPVPPLEVPAAALGDLVTLAQYEAIALFVERAQAVQHDFALTSANAPAVVEINQRLDGLPLAIELAAARVKILSPPALLARLGSRLKLLTGGARDLPARQQTLRSTMEWSYNLLNPGEQAVFRRLAVFVSSWSLAAAEAICHADGEAPLVVLDAVQSLVDKNLVRPAPGVADEPRYRMLDTIREYALEQLLTSGEAPLLRQQHAHFFRGLAETIEPKLPTSERDEWMDRLVADLDNLRAALEWYAIEARDDAGGLALAGALGWFWFLGGYWTEASTWIERLLQTTTSVAPPDTRAKGLHWLALLKWPQGDVAGARPLADESVALWRGLMAEPQARRGLALALTIHGLLAFAQGEPPIAQASLEESVATWREVGDPWGLGNALMFLGYVPYGLGDISTARAHFEESLRLWRTIGDAWGITTVLNNLAEVALIAGEYQRVVALSEESLALSTRPTDRGWVAWAMLNLGFALLELGERQRAHQHFEQSLRLLREVGVSARIPGCLVGLAGVLDASGYPNRAAHVCGAAQALLDSLGIPMRPSDRHQLERLERGIRARLGESRWAALLAEGHAMALEEAIVYALASAPPAAPAQLLPDAASEPHGQSPMYPAGLSKREVEVLRLVAQGLANVQIAERLVISPRTVQHHLTAIYHKIGVTNRTAATRFALDHGLL